MRGTLISAAWAGFGRLRGRDVTMIMGVIYMAWVAVTANVARFRVIDWLTFM